MLFAPTGNLVDVKFAMPVGSTAAVPRVVDPLAKLTEPVTDAVDGVVGTTCADNTTGRPCRLVAAEMVRAVVVVCAGSETVTLTLVEDEEA